MAPFVRNAQRTISVLVLVLMGHAAAAGEPTQTPEVLDDLLLLPTIEFEYEPSDPLAKRAALRTANESYSLLNDTVSDFWNISISPIHWRTRQWLLFLGVAGTTTGLIYLADEDVREAALDNGHFQRFGNDIQALGRGPALIAVTGGFLVSGMIFRDKELQTGKMLIEASLISQGYSIFLKRAIGRKRPGPLGPRYFKPWSNEFSLPSGETTNAFTVAAVVSEQYPNWPVRLLSYGLASSIAAGRIATDDHWTSDVFVGAVLGTFVGRSVAHLHQERDRRALERKRLGLEKEAYRPRHFFAVSSRGFRWTVRF
ncbi:MAG: phosphatase PAP2 family protein [Myxococcota bacterium]|nr:phosphatase PAP2 family protein [Myxococcota bacterium]